jgi:TRAP-type C4-dicarboxylate transport system permease small subunit
VKSGSKVLTTFLNGLIAFTLTAMAVLVFGNVVLRYVFNSGITWSEEMSRFLFVWMVFLGSIAALKENMHLGVDIVTNLLSRRWKKIFFIISNSLVLYVLWLVLDGSWKMTVLNMVSKAPATGMPLGYVYGIGVVMSIAMGLIILRNFYLVLTNKASESDLTLTPDIVRDSLEEANIGKKGGDKS